MMKAIIFFISLICESLCFLLGSAASKCITPELVCPNVNITFWFYTRKNRDYPFEISVADEESISKAPWVKHAAIKVLIHGYTGHRDFSPNTEIRPAYLECCDYNIISVDYNRIALEPCYLESARNTELVGMCLAQLIDTLVERGFKLSKFHIIGFSLGAQVAGFVSNYLKCGKPDRITALDPALPLFATKNTQKKIDASDAYFVDVLHTNALQRGKLETCGAADFFANSGMLQPGCKTTREQCEIRSIFPARRTEFEALTSALLRDATFLFISNNNSNITTPVTPLYVSRLHWSTTVEQDVDYIMSRTNFTLRIERLESHDRVNFNSFVVRVPTHYLPTFEKEFWPIGVVYRRFRGRLPNTLRPTSQTIRAASSCAHARAPIYFAESILTTTGFYATRCSSWLLHVVGWCQLSPTEEVLFGEYVSYNTSGIFFFTTNSEPPYAKGPSKAKNT